MIGPRYEIDHGVPLACMRFAQRPHQREIAKVPAAHSLILPSGRKQSPSAIESQAAHGTVVAFLCRQLTSLQEVAHEEPACLVRATQPPTIERTLEHARETIGIPNRNRNGHRPT